MAVKVVRNQRKNADGTYDIIHYETQAAAVWMSDGRSVDEVCGDVPTKTSDLTNDSGFVTSDHEHDEYVPTTRTVNGKALSSNITLSASDVGALPSSTTIPSAYTHPSTHAASMIAAGTFAATDVKAMTGTDYTTYRVRNAAIVSATPSSMSNGDIAFVYS